MKLMDYNHYTHAIEKKNVLHSTVFFVFYPKISQEKITKDFYSNFIVVWIVFCHDGGRKYMKWCNALSTIT